MSVSSMMPGICFVTFSTNCFVTVSSPVTNSAFTPSDFQRSMKLSSWDCAAVVSVPLIVR